jgi:uncharacterized protein involved in high-affinity Fe2+ transport
MARRWLGPFVAVFVAVGVGLVLLTNLERRPPSPQAQPKPSEPLSASPPRLLPGGGREYPIGEEQDRNHIRIAAVWLPSVQVEGPNVVTGTDVIHLEADVHATFGNPNGFALHEFVPYLTITYKIEPRAGGQALTGPMFPMVAADGLHYGASIRMPGPGQYRLTYHIEPPSKAGLGRHHDRFTGVAPWWEAFDVSFDWDYEGLPTSHEASARRPVWVRGSLGVGSFAGAVSLATASARWRSARSASKKHLTGDRLRLG